MEPGHLAVADIVGFIEGELDPVWLASSGIDFPRSPNRSSSSWKSQRVRFLPLEP